MWQLLPTTDGRPPDADFTPSSLLPTTDGRPPDADFTPSSLGPVSGQTGFTVPADGQRAVQACVVHCDGLQTEVDLQVSVALADSVDVQLLHIHQAQAGLGGLFLKQACNGM